MGSAVHGIIAPSAVYEIGGRCFETTTQGFADAVAAAHATRIRPRCMCLVDELEMYVARLGDGYIIKRMPDTGCRHSPDCPSYEPPPEFSGLGQMLGGAIREDPATGETTLKLGFPLSKMPGRQVPLSGVEADSVATDGVKLSLRGLLHYLWDQAELTRWHPGFFGKRSWATVRTHLLRAADHKIARGEALPSRLYVPEVFSVEHRHVINARRLARLSRAMPVPGRPRQLMLMIAEVKEIMPARYGYKAIIKHVPDQAFAMDELLYRRLESQFDEELALWGASDALHMMLIATLQVATSGLPTFVELSLMPVTSQWLPIETTFELALIDRLVHEHRTFVRGLRYGLHPDQLVASAILTDTSTPPSPLCISLTSYDGLGERPVVSTWSTPWVWDALKEEMPPLPAKRSAHSLHTAKPSA